MTKSPAFQFYPNDWLSSPKIALMTPAEEGAYVRLLCYDWANDGLPDDDQQLAVLSRLGEGWFEGGSTKLRECFVLRDGKLHNPRLEKEREKQEQWREKSREGGVASGKSRQKRKLQASAGRGNRRASGSKGGSHLVEPNTNSSSSSSEENAAHSHIETERATKRKYLDFVMLTEEEHRKLVEKFGQQGADERIQELNEGIGSKGYRYKAHYFTILSWDRKHNKEQNHDERPNQNRGSRKPPMQRPTANRDYDGQTSSVGSVIEV